MPPVCYKQDDNPKVVAMAVNTVMTMLMILLQIDFFSMIMIYDL